MVRLFKFEAYEVTIEPEAIMLVPFKTLYDRDKHKDKSMAKQELAYVYFFADPRSDYQYLVDPEVRSSEIIKGLGMPKGWKPDAAVQRAIDFYESFKPIERDVVECAIIVDEKCYTNYFKKILKLTNKINIISIFINSTAKARGSQTKALLEDED